MNPASTDDAAVRRELERVLASAGFLRNERMSRFLRFVAERHLEGSDDQLKESVVAVEVFGRKPDHDPAQDSIVRTEASRLRARLAEYYVAEGKDDPIVIDLPRGGYKPAFRVRERAARPVPAEKRPRGRVWLWMAGFAVALTIAAAAWMRQTERFWRNPIGQARFETVTDFDGTEQEAAASPDGKFIAFLSDRDGHIDVWVTQPGSGEFHNLTHGSAPELLNSSVRTLGFSPDGSLVTFWVRGPGSPGGQIGIWAAPTLGGAPRLYLEGAAEFDRSRDGARLAYHTAAPGDPLFVSDGAPHPEAKPIFTAPAGLHSHFPLWAPDGKFIYFVYGALPDKLDIWRIKPEGGTRERITSHNARVSHPVFLNRRTLAYLASAADGSGPWLYSIDVERRIPHRLTFGPDRYTSLAATADGTRLVVTRASPRRTLWRLRTGDTSGGFQPPSRIYLAAGPAFAPRLGAGYLIYVSPAGGSDSIWKSADGTDRELWSGPGAHIAGGPAISPDGGRIAFSVRQGSQTLLYTMRADGTGAHVAVDSLDLQGSPAWTPDGRWIVSAANDHGAPHLFKAPADGGAATLFLREYSLDPAWEPAGRFVVYSGPDIGTTFSVKAAAPDGAAYPLPRFTNLTRGARRLKFLAGRELAFLRGGIEHKDLWVTDLETGAERRLTSLPDDFDIRDFDISPDGREAVLERMQERSDIVMLNLSGRR